MVETTEFLLHFDPLKRCSLPLVKRIQVVIENISKSRGMPLTWTVATGTGVSFGRFPFYPCSGDSSKF